MFYKVRVSLGAAVIRNPLTLQVERIDIYASGFMYSGGSKIEGATEKILHEYYHSFLKGSREYAAYRILTELDDNERLPYKSRAHEKNAIDFARDMMKRHYK